MKRYGNLFEQAVSFETLLLAFRRAMKGCGRNHATCKFFFELEPQILNLQKEMKDGTYQPGAYHFFTIRDPKERVIAVAPFRDRVVHHAVVHVLTPIYERSFIYDSYATRAGKGTHAAILRAQKFMRHRRWYLKTDIEKYFDTADHQILLDILSRKLKDRNLMQLLERIIRNTPVPDKSLPIGNLTSQFLANVYLDPLDHRIKDELGVRCYVRYMDDFVLFSDSKKELLSLRSEIEQFLSQRLKLSLKPGATWLNRSSHGLSFLGMRIFPRFIRVKTENRKRSLRRLEKKITYWKQGQLDEDHMTQSLASIVGHLRYFCPKCRIDSVDRKFCRHCFSG